MVVNVNVNAASQTREMDPNFANGYKTLFNLAGFDGFVGGDVSMIGRL